MKFQYFAAATILASVNIASPAMAAKKQPPELVKCDESIGTFAVVDGDTAGWTEWGLGSPRELINALAAESGCLSPHNPTEGTPARFLITAIAGSQEEVDQGMQIAKSAATEALWRSGAASSVLSNVPLGGSLLGAFGGLGGKKKTVAAGLRVVSPASGLTVAAGRGSVKKSRIKFGSSGYGWAANAANAAGYSDSKDGKMLTEAFTIAFNQIISQRDTLYGSPEATPAASSAAAAVVAADTAMRAAPSPEAEEVRALRAGTELKPTGKREGLFIEVSDNYGTTGWVSVEDMQ